MFLNQLHVPTCSIVTRPLFVLGPRDKANLHSASFLCVHSVVMLQSVKFFSFGVQTVF